MPIFTDETADTATRPLPCDRIFKPSKRSLIASRSFFSLASSGSSSSIMPISEVTTTSRVV